MKKVFQIVQKRIAIILFSLLAVSCNSENGNDCFQAAGALVETTFSVSAFSEIRVEGEATLIVIQGETQEVIVETGENLLTDVSVTVLGDLLIIRDDNSCNFVREYGLTKVTVTTPVLTKIQNSSSYDVRGIGQLTFPQLTLQSNTSGGLADPLKVGDFHFNIACEQLVINANGQSVFYISGTAEKANIGFLDENPRFEGRDLIIGDLNIFHRSAAKIIVHPIDLIAGVITGTGDVICVNRPTVVAVEERFTGTLIFE